MKGETFIGVMDVAEEDTWTHLDGSSIANNDFWSTFWIDADLSLNQPNGGPTQNCAVINRRSHSLPNKTQDKSCTYRRKEMLCYKKVNCLKWNSTSDQLYREHCYWFTNKPSSMTSWTIVDAMNKCRDDGGYLAPLIDDQNYQFIKDDVLSTVFSLKSTRAWLGTHSIMGSPTNWNNDPAFVTLLSWSSFAEKCVVIDSNQMQSWIPCNTNSSTLAGAVCFKQGLGGDVPLISPEPITCEPEISSINVNSTTVEELKRILFIDPEHTNDNGNCLNWTSTTDTKYRHHCYWFTNKPFSMTSWTIVDAMNQCRYDGGYLAPIIDSLNYKFIKDAVLSAIEKHPNGDIPLIGVNFTSVEDIKNILSVDPKKTNAYKLKRISVYEDRPVAKAIGSVGVAVLISVIIFIIVLDCQRMQQCISKKKTKKSKKRKHNKVGTSDQN
ncbi:uncharacterized protein LOC127712885 [Mytilus californianus]|uniref:uncharacterized protein LOC127712885 n=1 Tax=Mytilus californianus TaxID=6549 RepID=UPI00224746E7|nr:uncharacterized protein LOC127712885 [Mytilus californianus]